MYPVEVRTLLWAVNIEETYLNAYAICLAMFDVSATYRLLVDLFFLLMKFSSDRSGLSIAIYCITSTIDQHFAMSSNIRLQQEALQVACNLIAKLF